MELAPLPPTFAATRAALHALARDVVSPARERVTGRIGLRSTPEGFGTPHFGDDERVRVAGAELVRESPAGETREPIAGVDPEASLALGAWYAFADSVL